MRSIREVCVHEHGEDEIRGWGNRPLGTRWVNSIQNENVWVVADGDAIYGLAYLSLPSENGEVRAFLDSLYLTPEVLGRGFGRRLMELVLQAARDAGARSIALNSTLTAHEFYLKAGFVDTGPRERREIAGYPVSYYPMRRELA
jgi:GNAT superfamily N-acetyltransferase